MKSRLSYIPALQRRAEFLNRYKARERAQLRIQNEKLGCGWGYAALSGLNVVAFAYRGLRSRGSLHPRLLSAAPLGLWKAAEPPMINDE